jgi:hypothetical protein
MNSAYCTETLFLRAFQRFGPVHDLVKTYSLLKRLSILAVVSMMDFVQDLSQMSVKEFHEQLLLCVAEHYRVHTHFP